MDQDNSKGQDKRNWRERLGIGAQGGKDLPKISDDFRKEAKEVPAPSGRPVATARPAPRPAAPCSRKARTDGTARQSKSYFPVAAPVSPDKLAERLRSQREASTRLAEQRVQVAKQRAEAQFTPAAPICKSCACRSTPATSPSCKAKIHICGRERRTARVASTSTRTPCCTRSATYATSNATCASAIGRHAGPMPFTQRHRCTGTSATCTTLSAANAAATVISPITTSSQCRLIGLLIRIRAMRHSQGMCRSSVAYVPPPADATVAAARICAAIKWATVECSATPIKPGYAPQPQQPGFNAGPRLDTSACTCS